MSKRSKRNKPRAIDIIAPLQPPPPVLPGGPAAGRWRLWPPSGANVLSLVAVIIAVIALKPNQRQADVASESADRAAGKLAAKFELADYRPLPTDFRQEHFVEFPLPGERTPYYPDVNQMVLNPPVVWVNNTGTEPIDAVRVETTYLRGLIDSRGKIDPATYKPDKDWYKEDTPVILRLSEKEEHVLQRQLPPGMSLSIPLLRGVLSHVAQAQSKKRIDSTHHFMLKSSVSCRLTGGTAYTSDGGEVAFSITWMPNGFGADELKRVLDGYQPNLSIGSRREVTLPRRWAGDLDGAAFGSSTTSPTRR